MKKEMPWVVIIITCLTIIVMLLSGFLVRKWGFRNKVETSSEDANDVSFEFMCDCGMVIQAVCSNRDSNDFDITCNQCGKVIQAASFVVGECVEMNAILADCTEDPNDTDSDAIEAGVIDSNTITVTEAAYVTFDEDGDVTDCGGDPNVMIEMIKDEQNRRHPELAILEKELVVLEKMYKQLEELLNQIKEIEK